MRLHRLHLSSRLWPRTLAMSWPHSHRVSGASRIGLDQGCGMLTASLILRTIIKIVWSIRDGASAVKRDFDKWFAPSGVAMPYNQTLWSFVRIYCGLALW